MAVFGFVGLATFEAKKITDPAASVVTGCLLWQRNRKAMTWPGWWWLEPWNFMTFHTLYIYILYIYVYIIIYIYMCVSICIYVFIYIYIYIYICICICMYIYMESSSQLNHHPEYIWNNNPNWRTPSFFRGVGWNHQPDPNDWHLSLQHLLVALQRFS